MSLFSVLSLNKVAFFLLVLVLLSLLTFIVLAQMTNPIGLEIVQHCVSSGGVCTGV